VNAEGELRQWNTSCESVANTKEARGKLRRKVGTGKMTVERLLGSSKII